MRRVRLKHVFSFFGGSVSNGIFSFCLIVLSTQAIVVVFGWSLTWDAIRAFFATPYGRASLYTLAGYVVEPLVTMVVTCFIGGRRQTITRRNWWMAYDFVQLFVQCITGLLAAFLRVARLPEWRRMKYKV